MAMVRKQLYLHPETEKRLKAEAKRRGVSEAQVIRERLDGVGSERETTPRFVPDPEALTRLRERWKLGVAAGNETRTEPAWKFSREELYEEDERMQRLYAIVDRARAPEGDARDSKAGSHKRGNVSPRG